MTQLPNLNSLNILLEENGAQVTIINEVGGIIQCKIDGQKLSALDTIKYFTRNRHHSNDLNEIVKMIYSSDNETKSLGRSIIYKNFSYQQLLEITNLIMIEEKLMIYLSDLQKITLLTLLV